MNEEAIIKKIKDLLEKNSEIAKELFDELLQPIGFYESTECDFFFKKNAERIVEVILKLTLRDIRKL